MLLVLLIALMELRRRSQSESAQASSQAIAASSALFHGLQDGEIHALLDVATRADYPAQSWVYRQGDPARHFFLVESGLVQLRLLTAQGEDVLIRFVKSGEVFGYLTLSLAGSNAESAQVIQPSRLVVWERDIALQSLQTIPKAAINLFNIAARDSVYFYDRSRRLLTQDVGRRVEFALSELVRTMGISTPGGIVVAHGIGQRELAELAGTTIFTVSRELTKLQRQGILEKQRGRIVVLQLEKLSA
ncbi:MAG: Crp/Fnr family transcriptional regulator [Terriglobales bacterium]